ncbi:putative Dna ligase 1 [Cardiosporidium cionae]|uniref:DNA ligase n=1 Tax=Cardiosporidium cionae TaxID=476202 RepID=A0ABQ7JD48_9APIC|nr:putative Dna ligase 1 [Cardiosporidium cionae]|eukprot:KAF8821911.1 putative Dna ligase 1 [Cardiosporidium cionae]
MSDIGCTSESSPYEELATTREQDSAAKCVPYEKQEAGTHAPPMLQGTQSSLFPEASAEGITEATTYEGTSAGYCLDDETQMDDIDENSNSAEENIKVTAQSSTGKNILNKMMLDAKGVQAKSNSKKKKKKSGQKKNQEAQVKTANKFACEIPANAESCYADMTSPLFDPACFEIIPFQIQKTSTRSLTFELLSTYNDKIELLKGSGIGSKKSSTTILTNIFRTLILYSPEDLIPAIYICLNRVAPEYIGIEVGVGDALLIKAMAETYGRNEAQIKKELEQSEDLGVVAESSCCKMRTLFPPPRLTIQGVFSDFKSISEYSGHNSHQRKKDKIKKMLVGAKKSEPKYIIRFFQQRMRIGVQSVTVYQALAYAFMLTTPMNEQAPCISDTRKASKESLKELDLRFSEMEKVVRTALCEVPNIERVVDYLLKGATEITLPKLCVVIPGIPVQPMLAKPTKGLNEVLDRFAACRFTSEFKYDGERAQLHMLGPGKFKVFSRNLEDATTKYPDVQQILVEATLPDVTAYIIDSEVVAFNAVENQILPFQVLSTRKRKMVDTSSITVNVCLFVFDCLRFGDKSLLSLSLEERRQYLHKCVQPIPGRIDFAQHSEMNSIDELDSFLQEAIEGSCEGIMVKTLEDNASYEPFKRSLNWLKVKKDYIDGLSDTVDLVPLGAFFGKGKRNGLYGAFLLAVYNDVDETFQTVCKAGTGFSDEILKEIHSFYKDKILQTKRSYYITSDKMEPDVWLDATQVWECRAADLSLSSVHTAGIGEKAIDKGIGLRFPRFLRIRTDKNPENATTSSQIMDLFDGQFLSKEKIDAPMIDDFNMESSSAEEE